MDFDGVLVVGGGLSGCSTAYHLTLAKQKVLSIVRSTLTSLQVMLLEAGVIGWGSADAEVTMKRAYVLG